MQQQTLFKVFENVQKSQKSRKEIMKMLKEALLGSDSYQKAKEEADKARAKLKEITLTILSDYKSEKDNLDIIKSEIENDKMLMADEALNLLVKGEQANITDKDGVEWIPEFSVKFKKVK